MFFLFLGAREVFESPELERFAQALETLQRRYPAITLGQLTTLLKVGLAPQREGENVSVSDIVDRSHGQAYPTIARQIDLLGSGAGSNPGLQLIDKAVDPTDRRGRYVAISERGKMLLQELDLILAPEIIERIAPVAKAEAETKP